MICKGIGARTLALALAAAVAVLLVATGCPGSAPATSVLLISIDSLRTDHVHALGYPRETTPVLDALIGEGTAWTGAVSPAPWTTPSMMTVMTGLDPDLHHVDEDDRMIDPGVSMLAERFRARGYRTAAFVPSATLTRRFGFDRGFDLYDERDFGHTTVTSAAQSSALIHWIGQSDAPFFAWVHFWDPHYNYNPPAPYDARFLPPAWRGRTVPASASRVIELKNRRTELPADEIEYLVSQYDGEIAYTDRYVGEVLDSLRGSSRLDRTLVVVLGDHGEAFQEHGWLTHTNTVYEETIRVPIIARLPGRVEAGRRIAAPCSPAAIGASIEEWAGAAPAEGSGTPAKGLPAADPSGAAERTTGAGGAAKPGAAAEGGTSAGSGGSPEAGRLTEAGGAEEELPTSATPVVTSMTRRQATLLSARVGRWSLILDFDLCRIELYDLATDPGQKVDLASSRPAALAAVRARIRESIQEGRRAHPVPVRRLEEEDPELFEKLGALGYADLFGDRLGKRSGADPLGCL